MWILIVCAYSSSGAMVKVNKPVAAVASVAIGHYSSPCLMSHKLVLSPPVPCPANFPCINQRCQSVVRYLLTSYPKCGSSVTMYTLVLDAPHFVGVGMSWCASSGSVVYEGSGALMFQTMPCPMDWSLPV